MADDVHHDGEHGRSASRSHGEEPSARPGDMHVSVLVEGRDLERMKSHKGMASQRSRKDEIPRRRRT